MQTRPGYEDLKKLDIIIAQERLPELNELFHRHETGGLSFYEIKGRGRSGVEPVAAGQGLSRPTPEFSSRTRVEAIVQDSEVDSLVREVIEVVCRGTASDGKIFVSDVLATYELGVADPDR